MQVIQGQFILFIGLCVTLGAFPGTTFAQPIIPANDGTGTLITPDGSQFNIEGGQLSEDEANLFHSFQEFGLSEGQIANFISNPNIENILGRVTGGNASYINGLIQVSGGNSNLFLINPSGMVFGPNAALNVPADFTATTATGVGFGENWLNAFGENSWSELVGNPNGLSFATAVPGAIVNEGDLAVSTGQNLNLFGGTVVNTGSLSAPAGQISVTAVPGESLLRLSAVGNVLNLEIAQSSDSGSVPVSPLSLPELLAGGQGLGSANHTVVNDDGTISLVRAEVQVAAVPGDAIVSGILDVSDISPLPFDAASSSTIQVLGTRVGLFDAQLDASGIEGGGNIFIGGDFQGKGTIPNAQYTFVDDNSSIFASALEFGDGGEVILWADDTTEFWGNISASGGFYGGNGGFVEVSGKETLVFRGDVDTDAPLGELGTLLLDPVDITIRAGTGDGATDGDNTFAGDPSGTPGVVEAEDTAPTTIYQSELEGLSGDTNLVLEASNDITLEDGVSLTLPSGDGEVRFTADSDSDGAGAFSMGVSDSIVTSGRNLEISGAEITVGSIDASDLAIGSGGNITLNAHGNVTTGQIFSDGLLDGGTIDITSTNGNIDTTAGDLIASSTEENGGDVTLNAHGSVTTGRIDSHGQLDGGSIQLTSSNGDINTTAGILDAYSNEGNGGNVTLTAQGSVTTGRIDSHGRSQGGNLQITSTNGDIDTTAGVILMNSNRGNAGDITLNAHGSVTTGRIGQFTSNGRLDGGSIQITSTNGDIDTTAGHLLANSTRGNGGDVTLTAQGSVTTDRIASEGRLNGGTIEITSTNGDIDTTAGHLLANSTRGNGGDVTLTAQGSVTTSRIASDGRLDGGTIDITSTDGDIDTSAGHLITESDERNAGDITLTAQGSVTTDRIRSGGLLNGGTVQITSTNGEIDTTAGHLITESEEGNAGDVTLTAQGSVTTDRIRSGGLLNGGNLQIASTNGDIDTTAGHLITESEEGNAGDVTLTAQGSVTTDRIRSGGLLNGGNLQIASTNGDIDTTAGHLITESDEGNAGDITLTAQGSVTTDRIRSDGQLDGGNVQITSTNGDIDTTAGNVSTRARERNGGDVTLTAQGSVTTGLIRSDGQLQGGNVQITSTNGDIDATAGFFAIIEAFSDEGNAGDVTLNAQGNVTTGLIRSDGRLQGGNLEITSTNGEIDTTAGTLETFSEDGNAGDVTLQGRDSITTADILSSSETGDGGHLQFTSTHGNIATGNLDTFTNGSGTGGQIDLTSNTTATSSISTGNLSTHSSNGEGGAIDVTAYSQIGTNDISTFGQLDSGDINLRILDNGEITTNNITTQTATGVSGNIAINGTNVDAANIQSIGNTGSGDIEIIAADGITTQIISTTTETGDSGDITTTSGGNTNVGDVSSISRTGDSGDIDVAAEGDLNAGDITSSAGGNSGDISTTSGGDTNVGDVSSLAQTGDSGNIDVAATGNLNAGDLTSSAGGNSGDINTTSGGETNVGDVTSIAQTGDSGNIDVTAQTNSIEEQPLSENSNLTPPETIDSTNIGNIASISAGGNSGNINVTSEGTLNTANVTSNAQIDSGNITLTSNQGDLNAGDVTSIAETGVAGDITLNAAGKINTGQLVSSGALGNGEITLNRVLPALRNQTENFLDAGNVTEGVNILDRLYTQEYSEYFGDHFNAGQPTVFETQAQLGNIDGQTDTKTGLIYTMVRDDRLELILVAAGSPPIHRTIEGVDRQTLLDTVAALRREVTDITRRQSTSYLPPAQQLHQWLVSPVEDQLQALGVDTLIFCMDEGLRLLPIAALHDEEQFLVEKYGLSIIPSMGLLDLNYINLQNAQVLAMGASEFSSQSPLPAVPAELSLITGDLEILQGNGTSKEKTSSPPPSGLRNGRAFLNEGFTLETLQTQSQQQPFGILHLATHAQFQPGQPENSYIEFWDESLPLDRFSDLGLEKSSFELLVLSACRTAFGDSRAELGFAGLAVRAGAQSALASLWYVSDDGTLALMSEFYSHLDQVMVKTEALRLAQIAMIREQVYLEQDKLYFSEANEGLVLPENVGRSGRRVLSHPYYWSSFTTIGNPW